MKSRHARRFRSGPFHGLAFRMWALVLVLPLLLGTSGCGGDAGPGRESESTLSAAATRGEGFNVLLISLDTTRADRLGCYGHAAAETPNIDRLAAEGALFARVVAPTPMTLPSHASLMTGTDPFVHGVRDNGMFQLDPANRTLAAALLEQSYATAAEIGSYVLNREFGLDQGFESYGDVRGKNERTAAEVGASGVERLRTLAARERPFFLFVHFYDAHYPYEAPARFAERLPDPYLAEIAFADEQVGLLLAELDSLGIRDETLVVLTGDHGESLGEHGEKTHSFFVYDATNTVPLIFSAPGTIEAGRRFEEQVRLIDVAPTVLDFVAVSDLSRAQGHSLLPRIENGAVSGDLAAYSESFFPWFKFGYSRLRAWSADGWKYVHAPRPELYDLARDPGERANLAAGDPQRVESMRAELRAWIAATPAIGGSGEARREMSEEDIERLRSLGYVGSVSAPGESEEEREPFDPAGPDPKDHLDVMTLSKEAAEAFGNGDLPRAEGMLGELFDASPDDDPGLLFAHELYGKLLSAEGRHTESLQHYRAVLRARPDDREMLTNLGAALLEIGEPDGAVGLLARAVELPPEMAATHVNYGSALAARKRYDDAIAQFHRALEIEPSNLAAYAGLRSALDSAGRAAEAVPLFEQAVKRFPDQAELRRQLAELLIAQRRPGDALAQYSELVRLTPDDPRAHRGLGLTYLQLRQADRAEASLRRSVELDPSVARTWYTLSGAQAAQGRLGDAIASAEKAAALAEQDGDPALADRIRRRIGEYRAAER